MRARSERLPPSRVGYDLLSASCRLCRAEPLADSWRSRPNFVGMVSVAQSLLVRAAARPRGGEQLRSQLERVWGTVVGVDVGSSGVG